MKKNANLKPYLIFSMTVNLMLAFLVCLPIQFKIGELKAKIEAQHEIIVLEKAVNDSLRDQQFDMLENISIIDENNEKAAQEAYGKITLLKKQNKKLQSLIDRLVDMLEIESGCQSGLVHKLVEEELK
jgi:hypothetical protein